MAQAAALRSPPPTHQRSSATAATYFTPLSTSVVPAPSTAPTTATKRPRWTPVRRIASTANSPAMPLRPSLAVACHNVPSTSSTDPKIRDSGSPQSDGRTVAARRSFVPLVDALKSAANQDVASFHFPGHNRGKAAPGSLSELTGLGMFFHDLPELPELDDLFSPAGPILDAQTRAAELFGASKTWFLVNGTTCGIHTSVMATCSADDHLVLPRNSHMSAISGLILSGATPKYIIPEYNPRWDIAGGAMPSQIERALTELEEQGKKAGAVLVTSPTYHGMCTDIEGVVAACHARSVPLIVDEAHGAHFQFHQSFPRTAMQQGADLAVQSTHKVLSSLTQSSMLHMAGRLVCGDMVSRCLRLLQSSSPSYLLLASLDAAAAQLTENDAIFNETVAMALDARSRLSEITGISLLAPSDFSSRFPAMDPLRITIGTSGLNISGYVADKVLSEQHSIVAEVVGTRSITFAINLGTRVKDIERLIGGAKHLSAMFLPSSSSSPPNTFRNPFKDISIRLTPREAFFARKKRVDVSASAGKVCGEMICPYPPGIPVLLPGELITDGAISYLLEVRDLGAAISGAADPSLSSILVCDC